LSGEALQMAFQTPQYEFERVKRAVEQQYAPNERDEVYSILEPYTVNGSRLPLCILHLAQGRIADVKHYAECARNDYRDVIYWAESPAESALDTPERIEDFQRTLKCCGLPRDASLDQEKTRLLAQNSARAAWMKPWWRFW
jgi:hypothetical protein